MKKIIKLFSLILVSITLAVSIFDVSEAKAMESVDCYDEFQWCDTISIYVACAEDLSYEGEHEWFTDCMETAGCG